MDVSHAPDISRREEETICLAVTYPIPTVVSTYPNRKGPAWPYSPSHPAHFALPRGHVPLRRNAASWHLHQPGACLVKRREGHSASPCHFHATADRQTNQPTTNRARR